MYVIHVTPTGAIRWLYDESLELPQLGLVSIARASHVEPDAAGHWTADLGPVGGPRLGPFPCRSAALAAERQWLDERLGSLPAPNRTFDRNHDRSGD